MKALINVNCQQIEMSLKLYDQKIQDILEISKSNNTLVHTCSSHGFSDDWILIKDNSICVLDFKNGNKLCRIYNGELILILFEADNTYRTTLKQIFRCYNERDFIRRLFDYYDLHTTDTENILKESNLSFVKIEDV